MYRVQPRYSEIFRGIGRNAVAARPPIFHENTLLGLVTSPHSSLDKMHWHTGRTPRVGWPPDHLYGSADHLLGSPDPLTWSPDHGIGLDSPSTRWTRARRSGIHVTFMYLHFYLCFNTWTWSNHALHVHNVTSYLCLHHFISYARVILHLDTIMIRDPLEFRLLIHVR